MDLSQSRGRKNSYLYTTELTSCFSKETLEVQENIRQYRQEGPDRARRISLPDVTELDKHQTLTTTTCTHMLRNFASSESFFKKASSKLQKSIKKKRPTSKTFTSYVDLDVAPGSTNSSVNSVKNESETRQAQASPKVTAKTLDPQAKSAGLGEATVNLNSKRSEPKSGFPKPEQEAKKVQTLLSLSKSKTESQKPVPRTVETKPPVSREGAKAGLPSSCEATKQLEAHQSVNERPGLETETPSSRDLNDKAGTSTDETKTRTELPGLGKVTEESGGGPEMTSLSSSEGLNDKGDCKKPDNSSENVDVQTNLCVASKSEESKLISDENEAAGKRAESKVEAPSNCEVKAGESRLRDDVSPLSLTSEIRRSESQVVDRHHTDVDSGASRNQSSPKGLESQVAASQSDLLGANNKAGLGKQDGTSQSPGRLGGNVNESSPEDSKRQDRLGVSVNKSPEGLGRQVETSHGPDRLRANIEVSTGSAERHAATSPAVGRLGGNIAQIRSRFENSSTVSMKPAPRPLKTSKWKPPTQ